MATGSSRWPNTVSRFHRGAAARRPGSAQRTKRRKRQPPIQVQSELGRDGAGGLSIGFDFDENAKLERVKGDFGCPDSPGFPCLEQALDWFESEPVEQLHRLVEVRHVDFDFRPLDNAALEAAFTLPGQTQSIVPP